MIFLALSPTTGDGLTPDTANGPKILVAFPQILQFEDVTGRHAANYHNAPDTVAVKCRAIKAVVDQIEAHPDYVVLRRADQANDRPDATLRQKIEDIITATGIPRAVIRSKILEWRDAGLTKEQVANRLARWIKNQ